MRESPVTIAALYALHGKARLRLTGNRLGNGFRFDAIAHEILDAQKWAIKTIITRDQFQTGCANQRQIVALHEFGSYGNWAVVQVEEHHAESGNLPSKILYSWRQWDLKRNVEIERIKTSRTQLAFHEDHRPGA